MSAQSSAPQTPPQFLTAPPAEEAPHPFAETHEPPAAQAREHAAPEQPSPEPDLTDDHRDALRHLRQQLRELLVLLEADDPNSGARPRS